MRRISILIAYCLVMLCVVIPPYQTYSLSLFGWASRHGLKSSIFEDLFLRPLSPLSFLRVVHYVLHVSILLYALSFPAWLASDFISSSGLRNKWLYLALGIAELLASIYTTSLLTFHIFVYNHKYFINYYVFILILYGSAAISIALTIPIFRRLVEQYVYHT